MVKTYFQRYWPQLACLLGFLLISAAFFSPLVGGKKVMFQQDIMQAQGMAHEAAEFKEKTGEQTLWTNSMFGGMPTYQINVSYPNIWTRYLFEALTYLFGYDRYPIASLWMFMTCFFLMLLAFRINVWVAAAVSIGYGFTTYNIIGIETGHANKVWALMYSPLILAGIRLALDKKYVSGFFVTTMAMALSVYANHLQITYYFAIAILVWLIVQLIFAIRRKSIKDFLVAGSILAAAAAIGISSNTSALWTTYEYGKESTRGGTDLTLDSTASPDGLDAGYIFNDYSYGHAEVLTFLIPNFSGGASVMDIDKKSELAKAINRYNDLPTYWGGQRYVAGPYYLGAILIFLMVLGIVVSKRISTKVWMMSAGGLALFLSMGDNFFLSETFYYYFPFYNKFRTPTMITAITQLCIAGLAALGLNEIWKSKGEAGVIKKLNLSLYITGGLCLLLALIGGNIFDFTNAMDEEYGIKDQTLDLFQQERINMMRADAFRSLALIVIAWALLWALLKKKLGAPLVIGLLAFVMLSDQWLVNLRYMSDKTYKRKTKNESLFVPSVADQQILQDPDPNFRVFNMSLSAFNDATTSYYHKSIGGYHGAKLRRYQELIEYQITPEIRKMQTVIQGRNPVELDSLMMSGMPVLNMLNTRYFIINAEGAPLRNNYSNGSAWFIKDLRWVKNPDQEILGIGAIDTRQTALIDSSRWLEKLGEIKAGNGEGNIALKSYAPNKLVYETNTLSDQVAVFSEIYYPYGWKVTIDGQEADYFRVNFVLRAMKVPAGKHEIVFTFQPESYEIGEKVSLGGSILLVIVCLGTLAYGLKQLKTASAKEGV